MAFTAKVEESESPENPLNLLLGAILGDSDSTRGGSRMGQVTTMCIFKDLLFLFYLRVATYMSVELE